MSLPTAVKNQLKQIEEKYGDTSEETTDVDEPKEPEVSEEPKEEFAPVEAPPEKQDEGDFKQLYEEERQRYLSLRGKFNAMVPSLQKRDEESSRRIAQLESELASRPQPNDEIEKLRADIADIRKENAELKKQPEPVQDTEIDALAREYGEDDPIVTKMRSMEKMLSSFQQHVQTLESQLSGVSGYVEQTKQAETTNAKVNSMMQKVNKALNGTADITTLNEDPAFIQWLSIRDHGHYQNRQQILNDAFHAGEVGAVCEMINLYISETDTGGKTSPSSLSDHVTREPSGQQPVTEFTRTPKTPAEIKAFYDRLAYAQRRRDYAEVERLKKEEANFLGS